LRTMGDPGGEAMTRFVKKTTARSRVLSLPVALRMSLLAATANSELCIMLTNESEALDLPPCEP
jgi:hypothetical protein